MMCFLLFIYPQRQGFVFHVSYQHRLREVTLKNTSTLAKESLITKHGMLQNPTQLILDVFLLVLREWGNDP